MERIINPVRERWVDLLKRPRMENADLQKICKAIFAEVLKDGDKALVKYTWFFDQAKGYQSYPTDPWICQSI